MTITFHLIEGDTTDYPYEEVKYDYYHTNMLNREIMAKYDLTISQWRRFIKQLKEDGLPLRSYPKGYNLKKKGKPVKNYYFEKSKGKFKVEKSIRGRKVFFGYCRTEKEAQERVALLRTNKWDGLL